MSIQHVKSINLPRIPDPRGVLSFLEGNKHVPFKIRRIFYVYDIPRGLSRGGHAHKTLEQFIIGLSGDFEVHVDDGKDKKTLELCNPSLGLYIPPMVWVTLVSFAPGSIYLVLASEVYDEGDYYRNYEDFLKASRNGI